ncbi:hypothetical protein VTK56DRAFT_8479 [Thermocarpiscus australiensis]
MFICRSCLRSLSGAGATPIEARLLRPLRRSTGFGSVRRAFGTSQVTLSRPAPSNDDKPEKGAGKSSYDKKLEWIVSKHLQYLKDPWHIAEHVRKALEKGSYDEALLMARKASRDGKVEVSWNHLIDYQMKNKRLHAAIKLYNEMKKRAQIPNAKTYTIIFRGCAESIHPKLAVAEATRIYNFMLHYGALKPNTIHMNAVLEVCSRAGDMENLFTVLASANDQLRAPDTATYTIILNALRYEASKADRGLGLIDADVKREIQKNLDRARAIWVEVIARWRAAKILLDEQLVCAMGKALTVGDYKDNASVLDLLEQTMKIPRFDKSGGTLPAAPKAKSEPEVGSEPQSSAADPPQASKEEEEPATTPAPGTLSPAERRKLAASRPVGSPIYPEPGKLTLSLVLTALANTKKTSHAAKYWDYFTRVRGVTPDTENYFCYLRALSVGHASAQTAEVVAAMPPSIVNFITFRIAFGTCIRDNLNKDAFRNACNIFDLMTARLRYADPLAMRLFLHCARSSVRHFYHQGPAGKLAHGRQLTTAVDKMWEPFRILVGSFSYPTAATTSPRHEDAMQRGDLQEVMATARRMIAAMDVVCNEQMADAETIEILRRRRVILQKLVERYVVKLYPENPLEQQQQKAKQEQLRKDMEEEMKKDMDEFARASASG